jgi:hypothetical protein
MVERITLRRRAIAPITLPTDPITTAVARMISVGLVPYCIQAEGDSIRLELGCPM